MKTLQLPLEKELLDEALVAATGLHSQVLSMHCDAMKIERSQKEQRLPDTIKRIQHSLLLEEAETAKAELDVLQAETELWDERISAAGKISDVLKKTQVKATTRSPR